MKNLLKLVGEPLHVLD